MESLFPFVSVVLPLLPHHRTWPSLVPSSTVATVSPSLTRSRCPHRKHFSGRFAASSPAADRRPSFVCGCYSEGECCVGHSDFDAASQIPAMALADQEMLATDLYQKPSSFCEKTVLLLEEGLTASQWKALASDSEVLASAPCEQLRTILRFLKSLNIQGQTAAIVLSRCPKIVHQSAEDLNAKVSFLQGSGLFKSSLERLVSTSPRTMCMSLVTLQKHVDQLLAIGIDGEGLNKIIWRSPSTLSWNISSLVTSLEEIGASKSSILVYLTRYQLSSVKTLARKLTILEDIGFNKSSEQAFRALWRLSLVPNDSIGKRFEFLKSQGLSHDEVVQIVTVQPGILAKTEENLSPKINYLVNVLNYDIKDIVKFPTYLTYSLENRIIPRFKEVMKAKEEGRLRGVLSLPNVLVRSRKTFPDLFVTEATTGERR